MKRTSVSIVKTSPHPTLKGPVMTCMTILKKMIGQKPVGVVWR